MCFQCFSNKHWRGQVGIILRKHFVWFYSMFWAETYFFWFPNVFGKNMPQSCVSLIPMFLPMFRPETSAIACSGDNQQGCSNRPCQVHLQPPGQQTDVKWIWSLTKHPRYGGLLSEGPQGDVAKEKCRSHCFFGLFRPGMKAAGIMCLFL